MEDAAAFCAPRVLLLLVLLLVLPSAAPASLREARPEVILFRCIAGDMTRPSGLSWRRSSAELTRPLCFQEFQVRGGSGSGSGNGNGNVGVFGSNGFVILSLNMFAYCLERGVSLGPLYTISASVRCIRAWWP